MWESPTKDFHNLSVLYWMALGPEDNVTEYYQNQVEMLEGFNEMDALAERRFIPGMSKVKFVSLCSVSSSK